MKRDDRLDDALWVRFPRCVVYHLVETFWDAKSAKPGDSIYRAYCSGRALKVRDVHVIAIRKARSRRCLACVAKAKAEAEKLEARP